jgi:hypothetical protein
MKFSANWFLDGKEVELPEMKIEGSLAVAELMKKHVDDFLPFVLTMQEEATLRLRVTVLSEIQTAGEKVSEEQKTQLKTICKIYNVPFDDLNIPKICEELLGRVIIELANSAQKSARVQITSTPFFLERSLIEAYYMLKAYLFEEARKTHAKPSISFSLEDLKTMINDPELATFARHSLQKMREAAGNEPSLETPNEEELKKKLQADLTMSSP